jgi:DNA-binding protein HU-beta
VESAEPASIKGLAACAAKNPRKLGVSGIFSLYTDERIPLLSELQTLVARTFSSKNDLGAGGASLGRISFSKELNMAAARMTQTQLVKALVDAVEGSTSKQVKALLAAYSEIAIKETKKNGVFVLPGLGRLVRQERKARMGRNPATGAAIKIPAKKVVKFRVAKAVKDAIVPPKKTK